MTTYQIVESCFRECNHRVDSGPEVYQLAWTLSKNCTKASTNSPVIVESNNIITERHAGGKKAMWVWAKLFIINIAVLSEVRKRCRIFATIWLEYKKAIDYSLLTAAEVSTLLASLVAAIKKLTKTWTSILIPTSESIMTISNAIS